MPLEKLLFSAFSQAFKSPYTTHRPSDKLTLRVMDTQTIKVSLQSIEIPAIKLYVHIISILVVFLLLKMIFGKQISYVISYLRDLLLGHITKKSHIDWTAHCRERRNWPQKQDALGLDLKGRYLKSVSFTISVVGKSQHWRAGIVLGNEKLKANQIIDTNNGITIHTGSDYDRKDKLLPIWKYYENFSHNNPDFSSVKSEGSGDVDLALNVNNKNFMQVKIQNEVIFAQRIQPSFRRRIYIKAWTDTSPDCKVKFKNITYALWS